MRLHLEVFRPQDVRKIESWFDDSDTQGWIGGRDWIRRAPSLLELTIGDEFRGKVVTGRRMWLSVDDHGVPAAFVDAELYDRYAAWDGSNQKEPVISDVVDLPSMGITLVVDPARRGRGLGSATLRAIAEEPELNHVGLFFGSVEVGNLASIRCFEKAGFVLRSDRPDFERMLHLSHERSSAT